MILLEVMLLRGWPMCRSISKLVYLQSWRFVHCARKLSGRTLRLRERDVPERCSTRRYSRWGCGRKMIFMTSKLNSQLAEISIDGSEHQHILGWWVGMLTARM